MAGGATSTTGTSKGGSLHAGSGGTGVSTNGGNGGTKLSSQGSAGGHYKGVGAISPTGAGSAANTQQTMVPARPYMPPPAGPRPQTDLAAATKLIGQGSAGLVRHSQLFPVQARLPGDATLSGPVLNSIGPVTGGASSFHSVQGITASESNGNIYPSNFRQAASKLESPSLWNGAASTVLASPAAADDVAAEQRNNSGASWFDWVKNAATLAGIAGLSLYMWRKAPRGARMSMPSGLPARLAT